MVTMNDMKNEQKQKHEDVCEKRNGLLYVRQLLRAFQIVGTADPVPRLWIPDPRRTQDSKKELDAAIGQLNLTYQLNAYSLLRSLLNRVINGYCLLLSHFN
jgi:hypothetical protein